MNPPHLNIVLNADSPLGFYLIHLLRSFGEEVIGVLTHKDVLLKELLHPEGLYFTRDFFFASDYVKEQKDAIKNIFMIYDNISALQSSDTYYQFLIEETFALEKPMTIFLSARIYGGQKMSSIPVGEVDQFKPDTLRGVDETWIAAYTRMRAKYNKFNIRTIIHPTMLSPLDYVLPERASDFEMNSFIEEFITNFSNGTDMIVKRKDLPSIYDIVHPMDVAYQGLLLTEHKKNGVYLLSSFKYPLNLSEILRNIAASLLYSTDLPNLKDLPIELINKQRHKLYPTNFDGMKVNGAINYQPVIEPEEVLRQLTISIINSFKDQDYHDYAIRFVENYIEE